MQLEARFKQIFQCLCEEDYDSALTLICPLIDSAGKKLYGIKKPGERFKRVLEEENDFLYWMLTGGMFIIDRRTNIAFSRHGKTDINLAQAIYKLVRNSLLHEGEMSNEITFVDEGAFGTRGNKIIFSKSLVWGLAFMLAYQPCYANDCPKQYRLVISGVPMSLQQVWGNKNEIKSFFSQHVFHWLGEK